MTFVTDIPGREARIISRIASAFRSVSDGLEARRAFERKVQELDALSDEALAAQGLTRADIPDFAYEVTYGK